MCDELELNHVLDREISHLSGGEVAAIRYRHDMHPKGGRVYV